MKNKLLSIILFLLSTCTFTACNSVNINVSTRSQSSIQETPTLVDDTDSKYKSYGLDKIEEVEKNGETYYLIKNFSSDLFENVENIIVKRTSDWEIETESELVPMPEEPIKVCSYDEMVEYLNKYGVVSKFNDKDKTYAVLFSNDIGWSIPSIVTIDQTNDKTVIYYYEHFRPVAPEYKSSFTIVQVDNKDVEFRRAIDDDQYVQATEPDYVMTEEKPIIYVYNNLKDKNVAVNIQKKTGEPVWLEYPTSTNGTWYISADGKGNIYYNNRYYNYLFWEDRQQLPFKFDVGFCVKGVDSAAFLEEALTKLGLNQKEQNDFITYWLPKMVKNEYNIIKFNPEEFCDMYKLHSIPEAMNTIDVYMIFRGVPEYTDIQPQDLTSINCPDRGQLTLVQWGGSEIR